MHLTLDRRDIQRVVGISGFRPVQERHRPGFLPLVRGDTLPRAVALSCSFQVSNRLRKSLLLGIKEIKNLAGEGRKS